MEGTSLAHEVVNNLFYSQYELLRAFLVVLAENHRGLAIELLLSVLKSGGRISGVFWSESIPSASHLAWMCWAELSWLTGKSTVIGWQQRWIESVATSGAFESLLYLEEISRCLKVNSFCRTKCSEEACPCYTRRTSEESAHVHSSGLERDQVDDSCRCQECEQPCLAATEKLVQVGKRGSRRQVISQCAGNVQQKCSPDAAGPLEFDCPLVEYLYLETLLVLKQLWRCEHPELKVIPEDPALVGDDLHRERDDYLRCADGGGIAEHVGDQIMGLSENTANLRSQRCIALVKKLILVSPELLAAFCKSSTKYSVKTQDVLLSNEGGSPNKEVQVSGNLGSWPDRGDRLMGLSNAESCAHYLLQTEAQSMHLQLVRQCVQMHKLMKAAKQLRYLNDSALLPRKDYRDVLKILFQAVAHATKGDGRLPFDGSAKTMEMIICSEVLATGRTALCLAAEESRLGEVAEMYGHGNCSVALPVYTSIHKRLQASISDEAIMVGISQGKEAITACVKCELFQYACARVAHIFGGIVNVTLSFIEALLFDLAADILSPVPHLRPLLIVMGWDLLSQEFAIRQKMLGTLWTCWQRAGPGEEQAERENGVGYICDMLSYQLELACFLAISPVDQKLAATGRGSCCTSDEIASFGEEAAAAADPFVANLILKQLGSHSPIQVLFEFLPNIDAEDALCLLSRQPVGLWGGSRTSDLELVHMYAGIGAATTAMCPSEWEGASNPKFTGEGSGILLGKLREHLELVCTPSRLLWMLDFVLSLLDVELLEMDHKFLHTKCGAVCSGSSVRKMATKWTEISARSSISGVLQGELVAIVKRRIPIENHTIRNVRGGKEESSSSIWDQKVLEIARLVGNWGWRLKGLHYLGNSHLPWQRTQALHMLHAAPSTVMNLFLQQGQYDAARESLDRFDMPEEEVLSLLLAEWIQKVEDVYVEGGGSWSPERALEETMGRTSSRAISEAILCLDFIIAFTSSAQSSKPLLNQALRILVESDKKQLGLSINFISSALKHLLDKIDEYLGQGHAPSLQTLLVLLDINPELRQGPKPRALLLLQQVIGDASTGKRQFLSGKLHNIVKALADDELDDFGALPERHFAKRIHGQIYLGSDGGLGLGFAAMIGSIGIVGAGGSYQASETVLNQLKKGGRRWLSFLGNKAAGFLSAFTLYTATIGDVVDGVDTTHDFNFFSLIHESPKDLLAQLVFEQGSLDAAVKVAEVMGVELVQQIISVSVCQVYPPFAGKGWASIFEAPTAGTAVGGKGLSTFRLWVDVINHLMSVSPSRAALLCIFGNSRLWFVNPAVLPQDQGQALLEFTLEQSEHYPVLHRWIQMQRNLQQLFHFPSTHNSGKVGRVKATPKRCHSHHQESCASGESHTVTMQTEDKMEGGMEADTSGTRKEVHRTYFPEEPYGSSIRFCGVCKLLFDWGIQQPCADAAWRLAGEGKVVDAVELADRWLCDGAPDSLLLLLVERGEGKATQENEWQPQPSCPRSWISSWQYCIRLRNKNLVARLAVRYNNCWELGAAIDVLTMCNCHLQPGDPQFSEVLNRRSSLLQLSRIMQADDDFKRWQEVESLCVSDPEGLALRLSGKGAVLEALEVAKSYRLPAELQIELQGRQLVKIFESGPADDGGPAAGLKFLLQHCESAFPIAMAALDQLPNLQSKQLLVQFIAKHHTGRLSDEDKEQVDQMVLGLRILCALPVPWQHRCSALHKHPKLIYETLLMWKQWQTALELQQAFPVLEDDVLVVAYAAKAINVISANAELWLSMSSRSERATSHATSAKSSLSSYLLSTAGGSYVSVPFTFGELDKESLVDSQVEMQKPGGTLPPSHRAAWEAMAGPTEGQVPGMVPEGYERTATLTLAEDWVLTGDPSRDETVRNSHRFESAPCPILFKSLLLLCSHEAVAAKAAIDLCVAQAKRVLGEEHLTFGGSVETIERAFSAAGAFATILQSSVIQLQNLVERAGVSCHVNKSSTSSSSCRHLVGTHDDLIDLLQSAQVWLGRIEVFQSLLESGVSASLNDILDEVSAMQLRDRLIAEERYSMAIITCVNCKVDAFPAWKAWGHSLLGTGGYAQAREKLKHALKLHKGDPTPTVWDLIMTIEGGPPADVLAVNDLYLHMVKNVHCSSDDSLSADSYLNVLHVPSFGKSDKVRWSCENSPGILAGHLQRSKGEDHFVRSNLDDTHFEECLFYLQEFCRQDMLAFSFQHGRYAQASQVLLRASGMFAPPHASSHQMQSPSFPKGPDWIKADYGSLDDLCDFFVGYAAIPVLELVLGASTSLSSNQEFDITAACVQRICNYCEAHRHFNHLYRFQLLKKDHVAAGLCRIQLFLISLSQDEAIRHLEQAKVHFNEGLLARQHAAAEGMRSVAKTTRIRSPSEKLTEEELIKFSARVSIQMDVARCFSDFEGRPWKYSLFGNPHDADTRRRRCEVVEILLDRNFDLAFKIIYEYSLPRTQIYAGFAASLAARKKNHQLTEFFRNIKGTIGDDDLDQILGAAISVYANRHRERPDRLIEMIVSSHRKILALVVCGRLKTAFQVACRAGSVSDVQFIAHQAQYAQASAVTDLCKQWLAQNLNCEL